MDDPGVHPPEHVDRHAAKQSRDQSHQRAEAQTEDTRRRMRGRDGRDRGGPVFGIAHGTDRKDVVLQQLEDDTQLETRGDVAEDRARHRPGHERARDHHLGQADEVHPDERAPDDQRDQQLDGKNHVNSETGTARAVGTSCAVTSTPPAASLRSFAASSSVKYTKRSRSLRPVRWCTPPTLNRFTCGARPASATAVSMSPTSRIPTRESDSQLGSMSAAFSTDANITSICGGTPIR